MARPAVPVTSTARLLAAAVACACGTAAPASATTRAVTNCSDAGTGSLRGVVALSADADVVDMSALACSPITLSTGAIQVGVANLTVLGKTQDTLAVDGSYKAAIFEHKGAGTLAVSDVTLRHGAYGRGGCIYSKGSLALTRVTVTGCKVVGYSGFAAGGGVFATGNLTLASSTLSNNKAYDGSFAGTYKALGAGAFAAGSAVVVGSTITTNTATSSGGAGGGGLYVIGNLSMSATTVSNNSATAVFNTNAAGGGLLVGGTLDLVASTVAGNNASLAGGLIAGYANHLATIANSTISNNSAAFAGGLAALGPLHLYNSTIAFNYAGGNEGGAGVFAKADAVFQSTIVANNTAGQGCTQKCAPTLAGAVDLSSGGYSVTISGGHNLIVSSASTVTLPADTLASDPMLAAFLENNGGPTQTLALNAGSPAIDHGNNARDLASDQRGAPFCRKSGSAVDIGAFETQPAQGCGLIFANGFEPPP